MRKFLLLLMLFTAICNVTGAVQLEGDGVDNLVHSVVYHPDDAEGATYKNFDNKLEIVCSWENIVAANHKLMNGSGQEPAPDVFWYRDGKDVYVLGVDGIALQIKNLSNVPMNIYLSESRYQLGSNF